MSLNRTELDAMRSKGSGWICAGILGACIVAIAPACSGNDGVGIPNVEAGSEASDRDGTLSDAPEPLDGAGSDASPPGDAPYDSSRDSSDDSRTDSADSATDAAPDAMTDAATTADADDAAASDGASDAPNDAAPPPCAPFASTESRACGMCGSQLRVCNTSLTWSDWSSCSGETGACLPGASDTTSAGCDSGSKTRTCDAACTWSPFGPCL